LLRENVFELVDYLNYQKIVHILAHPLFSLNDKLSLEHIEQMILLFQNFELNGSRNEYANSILQVILRGLNPKVIERLSNKHDLKPASSKSWIKVLTCGSDDHSSLNIARTYTIVPEAKTKSDFLNGLVNNRAFFKRSNSTPKTMAHNLYAIGYQFYSSRYKFNKLLRLDQIMQFTEWVLSGADKKRGFCTPSFKFLIGNKIFGLFLNSSSKRNSNNYLKKWRSLLSKDPELAHLLKDFQVNSDRKEEKWFNFVQKSTDCIIKDTFDRLLKEFRQAKIFNIFQIFGSISSIYTFLSPYFIAYKLFAQDRKFADECFEHFGYHKLKDKDNQACMAFFTDTFNELNGVSVILQMQMSIARKNEKDLFILTCSPNTTFQGAINFQPDGCFQLPEYPEILFSFPPFLQILNYCYEQKFSHIHVSTPGPMGLAGLLIAKILQLPVQGTYHTALPQYIAELTEDDEIEEWVWKYIVWYYNQLDLVFVPSQVMLEELASKGVQRKKIQLYPRGIDTKRFNPAKRNCFWQRKYNLNQKNTKLLYVGRVSKEKNLDILTKAYIDLINRGYDFQFIVVGDGPYLKEMKNDLKNTPTLFTKILTGENLAQAYASSDIFVFPSTTDTFGNVVLEAQSSGLPVIVSDKGGPQEIVLPDKTGLVVPAKNVRALTSAIIYLKENPDILKEMKVNARKYAETKTFEESFLTTWDLYLNQNEQKQPQQQFASAY